MWEPNELDADTIRRWIRDAWNRIRPFSTGGNYINFQIADDEERVKATYGVSFDRLVEVKKTYNPHSLFRVNRNIPRPGGRSDSAGHEGGSHHHSACGQRRYNGLRRRHPRLLRGCQE